MPTSGGFALLGESPEADESKKTKNGTVLLKGRTNKILLELLGSIKIIYLVAYWII